MEIGFQNPLYLFFLFSIPALFITHFYFLRHNRKKAMKFSNFEAMKRVTGNTLITKNRKMLFIRILVFTSFILSAAGPEVWYESDRAASNYVIAIDSSASMLARDIEPSRIEAAKESALKFVDKTSFNTEIGLISFSGVPFIEQMVTSNHLAVIKTIQEVKIIPAGGTDIGSAVVSATNLLVNSFGARNIILITDGSDTGGNFVDGLDAGITYAKQNHITIYTIGIGTGRGTAGYLPLNISAVYDTEVLGRIAKKTDGKFFESKDIGQLNDAFNEVFEQSKKGLVSIEFRFPFLLIGLILLFIEWGLVNTKFKLKP